MSIFGGSERFPDEPARSPGPIYGRPDVRAKGHAVMKPDYKPIDESRKWGKRESWIGGSYSPHIPVVSKESSRAPGHYNDNIEAIKIRAPKVSFPKSSRFLSQKVSVTGSAHQRELMTTDSPGPKYNVHSLTNNGGKTHAPQFSFAQNLPKSKARLPDFNSPRKSHRESWLSVINRNGVLIMPASPTMPRPDANTNATVSQNQQSDAIGSLNSNNNSRSSSPPRNNAIGSVFGHESRFGRRQEESPKTPRQSTRVQFVSAKHTRENMGEFSPGPIYDPYNPECPGGRLAPSPKSRQRPAPPGSPYDPKNPHANLNSRSSWLAGAVRKCEGQETVLMCTGDVPPGPGSYAEPRSSFATFSHNARTKGALMKPSRPSPRPSKHFQDDIKSSKSTARESSIRTPELATTQ